MRPDRFDFEEFDRQTDRLAVVAVVFAVLWVLFWAGVIGVVLVLLWRNFA